MNIILFIIYYFLIGLALAITLRTKMAEQIGIGSLGPQTDVPAFVIIILWPILSPFVVCFLMAVALDTLVDKVAKLVDRVIWGRNGQ